MGSQLINVLLRHFVRVEGNVFCKGYQRYLCWFQASMAIVLDDSLYLFGIEVIGTERRPVLNRSGTAIEAARRDDGQQLVMACVHGRPGHSEQVSPGCNGLRSQAKCFSGGACIAVGFYVFII